MRRAPPEPAAEPSEPLQAEQPCRVQSCAPHAGLCLLAARRRRWQRLQFSVRSRKDRLALHQASGCSNFSVFDVLYDSVGSTIPLQVFSTKFKKALAALTKNQMLKREKTKKGKIEQYVYLVFLILLIIIIIIIVVILLLLYIYIFFFTNCRLLLCL